MIKKHFQRLRSAEKYKRRCIMADRQVREGAILPRLGLVGATMNAAALIAPGAFCGLPISYRLPRQHQTEHRRQVTPLDIWMGIVLALFVAFLTALSYAQLAKIYPEAGFASCAYFAEKAWLDAKGEKRSGPQSIARILQARHRLVSSFVLLGLFGRYGRHDGHVDCLYLQPVHGP